MCMTWMNKKDMKFGIGEVRKCGFWPKSHENSQIGINTEVVFIEKIEKDRDGGFVTIMWRVTAKGRRMLERWFEKSEIEERALDEGYIVVGLDGVVSECELGPLVEKLCEDKEVRQ